MNDDQPKVGSTSASLFYYWNSYRISLNVCSYIIVWLAGSPPLSPLTRLQIQVGLTKSGVVC